MSDLQFAVPVTFWFFLAVFGVVAVEAFIFVWWGKFLARERTAAVHPSGYAAQDGACIEAPAAPGESQTRGQGAPGPGYHLAAIPRGVLGEVSKVKEELAELQDALAQNSKVMALVEAADLVGALQAFIDRYQVPVLAERINVPAFTSDAGLPRLQDAVQALDLSFSAQGATAFGLDSRVIDVVDALHLYLTQNHPGITLADLQTFANITKRAFANGHRSVR